MYNVLVDEELLIIHLTGKLHKTPVNYIIPFHDIYIVKYL